MTPGVRPAIATQVKSKAPLGVLRAARTGLHLDDETSWDNWQALGVRISTQADASRWWLGDWIVFGETHYGARYTSAIASTGLEYKTLRNYAVVARRYSMSRRRDKLSFAHHAELCALDDSDQDRWLDFAEEHGWSKNELRRQLRATSTPPADHVPMLRLAVIAEHRDLWARAAADSGWELADWIVETLDVAAARIVDE